MKRLTAKQRAVQVKKIKRWMNQVSKIIDREIEKYNHGDFSSWPATTPAHRRDRNSQMIRKKRTLARQKKLTRDELLRFADRMRNM